MRAVHSAALQFRPLDSTSSSCLSRLALASLKLGVRGTIFGLNVEKSICRGTYATTAICSVVPDGSPANSPLHPTQCSYSKTKAKTAPPSAHRRSCRNLQEISVASIECEWRLV